MTLNPIYNKVDTNAKLSVSGGELLCDGGNSTHGDPGITFPTSYARINGLTLVGKIKVSATGAVGPYLVWSSANPLSLTTHRIHALLFASTIVQFIAASGSLVNSAYSYATDTWYWLKIVLKTSGALYYVSINGVTWYLIWEDNSIITTPLYPCYYNYSAAAPKMDKWEWYKGPLRAPTISTTPAAVSLAFGSELITNSTDWTDTDTDGLADDWAWYLAHDATPSIVTGNGFTGNAQRIANGSAVNKDIIGQANLPGLGTWLQLTLKYRASDTLMIGSTDATWAMVNLAANTGDAASASKINRKSVAGSDLTFRVPTGGGQYYEIDEVSCKQITFSSLFSAAGDAGSKYGVFDFNHAAVAAGHYVGGSCCASSDHKYKLYCYTNKVAVVLIKRVNDVETTLISTTTGVTYADNRRIRIVVCPGSSGLTNAQVAIYYESAANAFTQIGTTQTVDLSSFGTLTEAFSTNAATQPVVTVNTGIGV